LALPTCIWLQRDALGDIRRLPYALAKYVQDTLHMTVDAIPTPSDAPLDLETLAWIPQTCAPIPCGAQRGAKVRGNCSVQPPQDRASQHQHPRTFAQPCVMCAMQEPDKRTRAGYVTCPAGR